MVSVTAPPKLIEITPPNAQMHFDAAVNAGWPPISTVGDPGAHGAVVTGVHGAGVNTPSAAAVNAAVAGFVRLLHNTNGKTLTNGLLSMIVATGLPSNIVGGPVGITTRVAGATPNEHDVIAPATTGCPTLLRLLRVGEGAGLVRHVRLSSQVVDYSNGGTRD
jgi:hypothetical protein